MRMLCVLGLVALTGCSMFSKADDGDMAEMEVVSHCVVSDDPVDDVDGAKADPKLHAEHDGKVYLFCCKSCKPKFEEDPDKFLANADKMKK